MKFSVSGATSATVLSENLTSVPINVTISLVPLPSLYQRHIPFRKETVFNNVKPLSSTYFIGLPSSS